MLNNPVCSPSAQTFLWEASERNRPRDVWCNQQELSNHYICQKDKPHG